MRNFIYTLYFAQTFVRSLIDWLFVFFDWFHDYVLTVSVFLLQKLKARARGMSPDIRQIDLDVNRTYRDHIMFMHRYDVK